jgi:hypothetical protein
MYQGYSVVTEISAFDTRKGTGAKSVAMQNNFVCSEENGGWRHDIKETA